MSNEDLISDNSDLIGETTGGALSTAPDAVAARREAFCQHYAANGGNATRAYLRAGYSEENAAHQAKLMMRDKEICTRIAQLRFGKSQDAIDIAMATKQLKAVLTFDPRKLFDDAGKLIPFHLLDDETALALKGMSNEAWSKERAIDMAMKHVGGYEKDNSQKGECLAIQVVVEN